MKKRKEAPELRVITEDVKAIIEKALQTEHEEYGLSVSVLAEKAGTSTRTVYRVLAVERKTVSLSLADNLCVAADAHVGECRMVNENGDIVSYYD
jgi:hypothetical protein